MTADAAMSLSLARLLLIPASVLLRKVVDWATGVAGKTLANARRIGFEAVPAWNVVNGAAGGFLLDQSDVAFVISAADRDFGVLVASKPGTSRLNKCVSPVIAQMSSRHIDTAF